MTGLRTYRDWAERGRHVKHSERAEFYLMSPDRADHVPLYSEEQTSDRSGWAEIVPASEVRRSKAPTPPVDIDDLPAI